jgi:transmembrane sensor
MTNRERFPILLEKYALNEISPEEHSEFLALASSGFFDDLVLQHIEKNLQIPETQTTGANLPPHRAADLLHNILSSEKQNALLIPGTSRKIKFIRWTAAAATAAAIGIIFFLAYRLNTTENAKPASIAAFTKDMKETVNTSGQPLRLKMEEGSIITLQPHSAIHYPVHFLPGKRELFLEGEAFFEISKNANRPFFVYNKNIVTHVLGTSFNVRMNTETKQVEVSVRSGRVEVYENAPFEKDNVVKKNNGVILFPNQKVVYDEAARQFVPSLVDKPLPVAIETDDKKIMAESVVFEETPLKTLLPYLEKSYGIEIIAENEDLYKCLFTGDISQQDLYARLDVICEAINASYEVKGTKILIKGKGCN